MTESEVRKMVREEISAAMNVILNGQTDGTTKDLEGISNLFPGMSTTLQRPTVFPYGFASRAPSKTLSISARVGDHPGNRYVIGHRDANRPDIESGETVLYNQFGQQVRLQDGKILIGSAGASQPFVLGTVLKTLLSSLLQELTIHTHAAPGAPPSDATKFADLKSNNLDNDAILSEVISGE